MPVKATIAVSQDLSNVRQALEREGYRVVDPDVDGGGADLMVISGMKKDTLGVADRRVDVPVIDATGRQTEEILHDVEKRLRLKG